MSSPVRTLRQSASSRLTTASPAGLRAALDPRGLRRREGGRRGRCRTTLPAALDDAQIAAVQASSFELRARGGTDPRGDAFTACTPHAGGTRCAAGEYTGNASFPWTITGVGAARRLSEVRR